jgi:DNA-binding transcriptional LysR family regulator
MATVVLSACAAAPKPVPAPVIAQPRPVPRPAPLPLPPADWRDAPQTPGVWTWALVSGRSTASFGLPGAAPFAVLSCDRAAGQVQLVRAGSAATAVPLAVATSNLRRPLMSDPARSPAGWLVVVLTARDPLLDAMAFSRGRFALEAAGLETLYLPAWPELSRVIEDCR